MVYKNIIGHIVVVILNYYGEINYWCKIKDLSIYLRQFVVTFGKIISIYIMTDDKCGLGV
jgi:hypothetical protein